MQFQSLVLYAKQPWSSQPRPSRAGKRIPGTAASAWAAVRRSPHTPSLDSFLPEFSPSGRGNPPAQAPRQPPRGSSAGHATLPTLDRPVTSVSKWRGSRLYPQVNLASMDPPPTSMPLSRDLAVEGGAQCPPCAGGGRDSLSAFGTARSSSKPWFLE
jgi:hypothetical protein